MTPSPRPTLHTGPGSVFGRELDQLCELMSYHEYCQTLWDTPIGIRYATMGRCVAASPFAALGMRNSKPFTIGWTVPVCSATISGISLPSLPRTASIHFACASANPQDLIIIGRQFMRLCAERYDKLLAIVPMPFRGTRAFIEAIGFRTLTILPKAAFILHRNRMADSCLMENNLCPTPMTPSQQTSTANACPQPAAATTAANPPATTAAPPAAANSSAN